MYVFISNGGFPPLTDLLIFIFLGAELLYETLCL